MSRRAWMFAPVHRCVYRGQMWLHAHQGLRVPIQHVGRRGQTSRARGGRHSRAFLTSVPDTPHALYLRPVPGTVPPQIDRQKNTALHALCLGCEELAGDQLGRAASIAKALTSSGECASRFAIRFC